MNATPQPGDRVRVTYETVVSPTGWHIGKGHVRRDDAENARVQIIKRADTTYDDPTSVYIADVLDRAQKCFTAMLDPETSEHTRYADTLSFICHVQTSVLLENLGRLDQKLADDLVGWFERIFEDGYAGELVHEWRQQTAAGRPMHPINPAEEDAVDANEDLADLRAKLAAPADLTTDQKVPDAACGAVSDIGVRCGEPAGHEDHHKGAGTDEHGEPMLSRWSNTEATDV